ncbi:hypothetical protein [Caldanaerobacter sp.]|uniref:hypothetical protein n=1 Tax=Caldanaerobacter sp. TaxID=2930036 RepID=UPI003C72ECAE
MTAPNPIDLKSILPRTVEVGNLKQVDLQKPNVYSQQLSVSINRENEIKKSKTNELEKSEKTYIKEKGFRDRKEEQKGRKKDKQKNIGHIDIKI